MQWCCETNILFKSLACDMVPHFTTLAAFVSNHGEEIEALFEQVSCARSSGCWAMWIKNTRSSSTPRRSAKARSTIP
ncbi:hypothetical protein ACMDCT_01615 [Halomonadaceae bacterium KBTZ08]